MNREDGSPIPVSGSRPGAAATRSRRRGFTVTEMVVTMALFVLVVSLSQSLLFAATTGTVRTLRRDDSLRSVEMVLELIRSDVNRMVLVDPTQDLAVLDGGRGLSMRLPAGEGADFWDVDCEPVTYALEAVSSGSRMHRLLRKASSRTTVIGGCFLESLSVKVHGPGELSRNQSYLEITVVGVAGDGGSTSRSASALIPITVMAPPDATLLE